jgi:hypothetical protein
MDGERFFGLGKAPNGHRKAVSNGQWSRGETIKWQDDTRHFKGLMKAVNYYSPEIARPTEPNQGLNSQQYGVLTLKK